MIEFIYSIGMLKNLATKLEGVTFIAWNRSPDAILELQSLLPGKIEIASSAAEVINTCFLVLSPALYLLLS